MNRVTAAIFLVLLCSGCPKSLSFGPEGPLEDPAALLALTNAAEAQVVTVRADGKLRVESPQGNGTVGLFVALSRPGLLHLETLDFFGRPQAVLVSDGQRFGLYQADENRYYQGPASARNLSRFLPVALPPQELVSIMLGAAPRLPAEKQSLRVDKGEGVYVLTLERAPGRQVLKVDTVHHRVRSSRVEGVEAYHLAFEDLKQVGKGVFPRRIQLEAPSAHTSLELRYTELSLNEAPDLTLFELAPPEGVPVVEVDEEGRALSPPSPESR